MACVLFQDPIHPYAIHLMQHVQRRYGHRAVSFFTERRRRLRFEASYPALRSRDVARFGARTPRARDAVAAYMRRVHVRPLVMEEHAELKTHLMERDIMCASFHPRSSKAAAQNPKFLPYRAPIPCFVVRHVDARDIVFLGHNRAAFERFQPRFHDQFARGLVSNESGYADMYQEALARFSRGTTSGKV